MHKKRKQKVERSWRWSYLFWREEQRQLCRDRLDDLNTEKQAGLEILSQNRRNHQMQAAETTTTTTKTI